MDKTSTADQEKKSNQQFNASFRMKIVVLGYIIKGPMGGMSAHYLQYILGLKALGHEVLYLEDSDHYPSCYNPQTLEMSKCPAYGLKYTSKLFQKFDLKNNWSYYDDHNGTWYGLSKQKTLSFCKKADLVINISGANPLRDWWTNIPCRTFIETDPLYTQVKHLTDKNSRHITESHTSFFSFGENIGKENCSIPDDGFLWRPTRQPVFLPMWPKSEANYKGNWTTIMQWKSYAQAEFNGKIYGMKSESFQPFIKLPAYFKDEHFEIASSGTSHDTKGTLMKKGWKIKDPIIPSKSFKSFQDYINSSKGEWTVAKPGYVETNSGWFSERTLNYMASGKPVIVQNSGFSDFLPVGKGLLCFTSIEEAVDQINRVKSDYKINCLQSRKIVEEHFNYETILSNILNQIK